MNNPSHNFRGNFNNQFPQPPFMNVQQQQCQQNLEFGNRFPINFDTPPPGFPIPGPQSFAHNNHGVGFGNSPNFIPNNYRTPFAYRSRNKPPLNTHSDSGNMCYGSFPLPSGNMYRPFPRMNFPPPIFKSQNQTPRSAEPISAPNKITPISNKLPFSHPFDERVPSFKKDQEFVDEWIQSKIQNRKPATTKDRNSEDVPKRLCDVFRDISSFRKSLEQLKTDKSSSILEKQVEDLSNKISSPQYQDKVKCLVERRRKQRLRHRNAKRKRMEQRMLKHQLIDKKIQDTIDSENTAKRQKKINEEADSVLREVHSKQAESSNLLKVLSKIEELRLNRLKRGDQQGFISDEQHDQYFENMISGLRQLVENQIEDYTSEEKTLNVMIEQHHSHPEESSLCDEQLLETHHISEIYFGIRDGSLYEHYTSEDMESSRRSKWQRYLDTDGSEMPLQWALPPATEGTAWSKWKA